MKSTLLTVLLSVLFLPGFCQQITKPDDALLMDLYQNQRYNDAADYLKRTFPEPVTDLTILSRLAYASQMANKLADAEGYYQRAYAMDSTNKIILFNMAGINLKRGNFARAELYYKSILLRDTGSFAVYTQLGSLAERKNDTTAAINYLIRANRINPFDTDVAGELSDLLVTLKRFDEALKILNKAAENDPDNIAILISTAKLTYSESKWAETVTICNKLQQMNAAHAEILTKLGIAYYNLKNYNCGAETFALLNGMEQTEYTYYYTALCYKELKDQIQAINFMKLAIAQGISPNISTYYAEIANSDEKLNRYKKAAAAYQKALQFNEDATIYYLLASLYDVKLQDKRNAVIYYKKFLASHSKRKKQVYLEYAKSRVEQLTR